MWHWDVTTLSWLIAGALPLSYDPLWVESKLAVESLSPRAEELIILLTIIKRYAYINSKKMLLQNCKRPLRAAFQVEQSFNAYCLITCQWIFKYCPPPPQPMTVPCLCFGYIQADIPGMIMSQLWFFFPVSSFPINACSVWVSCWNLCRKMIPAMVRQLICKLILNPFQPEAVEPDKGPEESLCLWLARKLSPSQKKNDTLNAFQWLALQLMAARHTHGVALGTGFSSRTYWG